MADDIYRNYDKYSDGPRSRSQSIFSDEGSRGRSRSDERGYERSRGRGEDRGVLEKAGEEIRSWFGDDDRDERSRYGGERDRSSGRYDSNRSYGRSEERYPGGVQSWGQANDSDDERGRRTGSHQDDHYRTWRERQMAELDRDYEDYCRERQQQFDSDFTSWRNQRRQGRSSTGSTGGTSRAGETGTAASSRTGTGESTADAPGAAMSDSDSSVKSSAAATQGRSTTRSRS